MKKRKGFTLIELLVVISIVVLVIAILLPALNLVRELANRSVCSSNIRQMLVALISYSDDNENRLPENKGGYWLWDVDRDTTSYILKSGVVRETFYCPSNRIQKLTMDERWNFLGPDNSYRVTGYFWKLYNPNMSGWTYYFDREQTRQTKFEEKLAKKISVKHPADFELIMDATLSAGIDPPDFPYGNFSRIETPYSVVYDSSNHIKRPEEAHGGNMGFADGHVKWRQFSDMCIRLDRDPLHWW